MGSSGGAHSRQRGTTRYCGREASLGRPPGRHDAHRRLAPGHSPPREDMSARSPTATGRASFTAIMCPSYRGLITIWSNASAHTVITNGVQQGAKSPRPSWYSVAPCVWLPQLQHGCEPSPLVNSPPRASVRGNRGVMPWRHAASSAPSVVAFAVIQWPILHSLRLIYSSSFCRPRKKPHFFGKT